MEGRGKSLPVASASHQTSEVLTDWLAVLANRLEGLSADA
ncbi:hypothetical protein ANRL3_01480 [Anaerolineae bacterium]|nr:hypothetical protein ANRL3_01480 [Anaerolineae bacterium]